MANITITNNDLASVEHRDCRYQDETLNLSGAQTVAAGRILARDSASLKLVNYVPGGAALKSTADGPFSLSAGDTVIVDVDDAGAATATFDAASATIADTTTYTGGTAATITDTTSYGGGTAATITDTTAYPCADQDGLTSIITVNGGTPQTVTFSGATTTAAGVAAQMADQLTGVSVVVTGGQVVLTTDEVGEDATLAAAAGTGGLTWAASVAGTGGLADQDGLTSIITVNGGTPQTVTFSGVTTEASEIAAQMNAQLSGVTAAVVGGQVKLTTDEVGVDATLAAAAGTGGLTWGAPVAGTGGLADQDGLTEIVTISGGPFDGVAQTVTFSGVTTEVAEVAAQMAAQLDGCSVEVSGGQLLITTDGQGTDFDITIGTGTCSLVWAAATAGTGDVGDISAVTATEFKTVVEADTTATVTVSGDAAVIKGTTELDFTGGTGLTKFGLSVETITANENGVPKAVMPYELAGSNGDNYIRAIVAGEVREDQLSIADGTTVTAAHTDLLRVYGITAVDTSELQIQDNQ